jgi:hypothetical protein
VDEARAELVVTLRRLLDVAVLGAVGRYESQGYPSMLAVHAVSRKLGWRPRRVMEALDRAINREW